MARQNRTVAQCAEAIRNAGGFITVAAKQLGMSHPALSKRVKNSEALQQVLNETKEQYLDLAESQLVEAVKDRESWAICFYLKCKGKDRGYVEKQQIDNTSSDGSMSLPNRIEIVPAGFDEQEPDSTS